MSSLIGVHPAAWAAACWWGDAVAAGGQQVTLSPGERAADAVAAAGDVLASRLRDQYKATPTQADLFTIALARTIDVDVPFGGDLAVDYGPGGILLDAARHAGVHSLAFPMKTVMWVYHTHVVVSAGYQAPETLVWSAPDWIRPSCGRQRWDAEPTPRPFVCAHLRFHDGECGFWSPISVCDMCGRRRAAHRHEPLSHPVQHWFQPLPPGVEASGAPY